MEESFRNAGVLAYCRSFVPNEKTIRQDRGIDFRLGQPSDNNSQPQTSGRSLWTIRTGTTRATALPSWLAS
jgi:hypothetical protein